MPRAPALRKSRDTAGAGRSSRVIAIVIGRRLTRAPRMRTFDKVDRARARRVRVDMYTASIARDVAIVRRVDMITGSHDHESRSRKSIDD
jgi:hypothetical protein